MFDGKLVDENAKVLDEHQVVKRDHMPEYRTSRKQERLMEIVNLESLLTSVNRDLKIMSRDIEMVEDVIRSIEQGLYNLRVSLSKGR